MYPREYAVGFNKIDIDGRDFFLSQGGQMVSICDNGSIGTRYILDILTK